MSKEGGLTALFFYDIILMRGAHIPPDGIGAHAVGSRMNPATSLQRF